MKLTKKQRALKDLEALHKINLEYYFENHGRSDNDFVTKQFEENLVSIKRLENYIKTR
jgi:hypothetical protein